MNAPSYQETTLNTLTWWASQLAAKSYATAGVRFLWFDDRDNLEAMYQVCLARGVTVLRYGLTLEVT
jgi:hypothetical protein